MGGQDYDSDEDVPFEKELDLSMDNVIVVDNLPVREATLKCKCSILGGGGDVG